MNVNEMDRETLVKLYSRDMILKLALAIDGIRDPYLAMEWAVNTGLLEARGPGQVAVTEKGVEWMFVFAKAEREEPEFFRLARLRGLIAA